MNQIAAKSPLKRSARVNLALCLFIGIAGAGFTLPALSQDSTQSSIDSSVDSTPTIPQQVQFSGSLPTHSGETIAAVFRIYAAAEGGEPLWSEEQRIGVDKLGAFTVVLGAASNSGLPQTLFLGGAPRWLGISANGSDELERVPLSSVPYAMKSGDAESLGGHKPTDFVTQDQLATLATAQPAQSNLQSDPLTTGPVSQAIGTITGTGTTGYIPEFTGANIIGNSLLTENDLTINVHGTLGMYAMGTATKSLAYSSQQFTLTGSSYSSTLAEPIAQNWSWQVSPLSNDTASPGSVLDLIYGTSKIAPHAILSISTDGAINFSSAQTFRNTISSINASSPLTASTTSGVTTLGVDLPTLESDIEPAVLTAIQPSLTSDFNSLYAQLAAGNTFTAAQTISGTNSSGSMLAVSNNSGSSGSALSVSNGGQYGIGITASASVDGTAIQGFGAQTAGSIGILGALQNGNGLSYSFYLLNSDDGLDSGLWADTATGAESALIATADDANAGIFYNDSATSTTIVVLNNNSSGTTGLAKPAISNVMRIGGPGGICGFSQQGNISCTGQVKSIVSTSDGTRQVETYAVHSAENWIEDYGSGQLNQGSVTVTLDPSFTQIVNTGEDFHVFLTPGGDCKGLYVTNKTGNSFEVHEMAGGRSNISFDYKIVAKRNGLEAQRLVDVTGQMHLEAKAAQLKKLDKPLPRKNRQVTRP